MSKKPVILFLAAAFCAPAFALGPEVSTDADFGAEISKISEALEENKSKYLEQHDLRDLLRDPNPQIRKAAVKRAKDHILNSYVSNEVTDILNNRKELVEIRIEAARTLSYATSQNRVRDALLDVIRYNNEPRELRVMAYKALWTATNYSQERDFLLDAVKYVEKDRDARRAAIWALFAASQNYNVRDGLLDIVRNRTGEEEAARIEAIKSLYGAMGHYDVKDKLTDIARDTTERKPVRLMALKALSGANNDSSVKRLLEDTVKYDKDTELREAALWALAPTRGEINELFHLGYKIENGPFINPIEKE